MKLSISLFMGFILGAVVENKCAPSVVAVVFVFIAALTLFGFYLKSKAKVTDNKRYAVAVPLGFASMEVVSEKLPSGKWDLYILLK